MASFPSRHPIVLAYQWASLDQLSNGRMIMAACMGVPESQDLARIELNNMGITNRERGPRLEEGITILRRLWTEESVTFKGRFYELEEAFVEPKPVQEPPPIWVIGTPSLRGGRPRNRAQPTKGCQARRWLDDDRLAPSDFAELRGRILEYAADHDRSFDGLPCALYYNININEDRDVAVEESKRYLEGYYAPQVFSRKAVEGWVACGPPEAVCRTASGLC